MPATETIQAAVAAMQTKNRPDVWQNANGTYSHRANRACEWDCEADCRFDLRLHGERA